MKIIAVIPARFGSTRFPGKPLELLKGKPIIQWVIEGVQSSKLIDDIYVATDDERIAHVVNGLKTQVIMTSSNCPTGTDRIYAATQKLNYDVVLNVQGDEPQINHNYIDPLAMAFKNNIHLDMATLSHPMMLEDVQNMNAVKVIKNINQEAIYFSRFPIPYSREKLDSQNIICEKHIGLYGYSRTFLKKFCESPQSDIEKYESLEQLRALYLGAKIKVLSVDRPIQGVDTPEDLAKLETLI